MTYFKQFIFLPQLQQLIKRSFIAWLIFFIVFDIYCIFWRQYGMGLNYDFIDSFIWWFEEWGAWLISTPLLWSALEHSLKRFSLIATLSLSSLVFLPLMLAIRMWIGYPNQADNLAQTVVTIFPQYATAYVICILAWYFMVHDKKHLVETEDIAKPENVPVSKKLTVEHSGLNLEIDIDSIFSIKAAGNYVEIFCLNASYIKRTTLKQMVESLSENKFMQVHRSYFINLTKAKKLVNTDTGAGLLTLTNEQTIPVSKKYKTSLKQACILEY